MPITNCGQWLRKPKDMPSPSHRGQCALNPLVAASLLACLCTAHGQTQTPPDAGALLRESRQQAVPPPALPQVQAPRLLRDTGVKVRVQRFEITGASRIDNAALQSRLADLVGQELGFAQMQAAADRIAALYRERGLHATALLPEQTLADGVLRIVVVEGRLGKVRVESTVPASRRVPQALAERMLRQGQTAGEIIDTQALERATLLANELPGLRVSVLLAAGTAPGETDIIAKIDPRPLLTGAVLLDNHDARATGAAKAGVAVSWASPLGLGDELQLAATANTGKRYVRAVYGVPLGATGLRAALNVSSMTYRLVGDFKASGGEGSADTAGVSLLAPLLRSAERNLVLSAAYDRKHLQNGSSAGPLSDKTDGSVTLGMSGDSTDALGGGGALVGSAQLTAGRLDLSGNAADLAADAAGLRHNGSFSKLNANLGRLQRLTGNGNLWLQLAGQVARRNLDSGQKFSLGGASGVRAYPSLEGSGDNGWLATVEYRHRLGDALQLTAFYDHGEVTRERNPLPSSPAPNRYALKGVGVGADWQLSGGPLLRAVLASRISNNPAAGPNGRDSDGTKRRPQVWLAATMPF